MVMEAFQTSAHLTKLHPEETLYHLLPSLLFSLHSLLLLLLLLLFLLLSLLPWTASSASLHGS
jgi:hypothetical protein